jgi:transaldolase
MVCFIIRSSLYIHNAWCSYFYSSTPFSLVFNTHPSTTIIGFTTNPTILKRDNVACTIPSMRHLTRVAFSDMGALEIQLQAWGTTEAELYSCALDLYELDERVVVKLPMTLEGLKATRRLVDDDVPITLTGMYSSHQAVTALASGAVYGAAYLGRMQDAGKNAIEEISKMQSIIDMCTNYEGEMRLLVASIRSADDIATLAAEGCNTFTISPAVAEQLVSDPLTMKAAEVFQEHADEMGGMRDH